MKKVLLSVVLLSVFVVFGFTKGEGDSNGTEKIGFLVKQPEEPWFQTEWRYADQAGKEYGFEVVKIGTPDGEKVIAAIDSLAAQGVKGFVICTPNTKLGPSIVAKANSYGIKVFAVDDRFVGSDGNVMAEVPYMGISAFNIGKSVGMSLYEQMQKMGWNMSKVGAMELTFASLETAKQRTDGARESLLEMGFPETHIYEAAHRTSDQEGAFNAANALLPKYQNIEYWLVYGMNDAVVAGAIRALEGAGFTAENTIGIGINGSAIATAEFEKDSSGFWGSILLDAKQHGYDTARLMYEWIKNGVEPPAETFTSGTLITRNNYKNIMNQ